MVSSSNLSNSTFNHYFIETNVSCRYQGTDYVQQKKQYNQTKPPATSVPLGQESMFI